MAAMTLRLFGRFDLFRQGCPVAALGTRRARELLGYLALHRSRPQQREALAGLLWEEAPPELARKYLRQALWQVQTALHGDDEAGADAMLEVDPEWIQLNESDALEIDVSRFEGAVCRCRGVGGAQLCSAHREALVDAVGLVRGELLDGCYANWCLLERERLQIDYLEALEKLVAACEACGDCERGLDFARRVLAIDPAREPAHRGVMRLHLAAGNRAEALRAFERCERVLQQEFGVRPSRQTLLAYEAIRSDGADAPPIAANLAGEQLRALMDVLERARELLAALEARVRGDLVVPRELD